MKTRTFGTIALFFFIALIAASGGGCGGPAANDNLNTNTAKAHGDGKTNSAGTTEYPPLPTGLAEAEFELLDGTKFKVSEKKGKVVLLNLWGTWCGPCRAEMPTLIALQDQYRAQGLEIVGLNVGDGNGTPEPTDLINDFVGKMKLNYTIARSSNATTRQFKGVTNSDAVPQSVLVDRQGRLRGVFVGSGDRIYTLLSSTISKVISE